MTSLKQSDYPRPLVQYWLRGVIEDESAQTTFVWRLDLDHVNFAGGGGENDEVLSRRVVELATAIPLQPKERANIATSRATLLLKALAVKFPDRPAVLINSGGEAKAYALLHFKDNKDIFATLAFSTVILPCSVGGLDGDGNPTINPKDSRPVADVVEQEHKEWARYLIVRHPSDSYSITQYGQIGDEADEAKLFSSWQAAVKSVPKDKGVCGNAKDIQKAFAEVKEDEKTAVSYVAFFFNPKAGNVEDRASLEADRLLREEDDEVGSLGLLQTRTVAEHDADVELYVRNLAERIGLPDEIIEALAAAGFRHDKGKAREWWQKAVGNFEEFAFRPIAKSDNNSFDHSFNQGYRHEFGSLVESLEDEELKAHPHRDLILHLIAAHHGYARPHFPERAFDRHQPKPLNRQIAHETMLRFNRLQRQYGWWQLAYLEAILKGADAMASHDFGR